MWGDPKGITEANIEKRIAKGFGMGEGGSYIPWIQKHDFGSKGTAKEVPGVKIQRSHHLLSQLEYKFFLIFEFLWMILDIREQFPLFDRELVAQIVRKMGCRMPYYPGTRTPYVLTTDFLLTLETCAGPILVACGVKYKKDSQKKRAKQLLEVEERYWNEYGIPWFLLTEEMIDRNVFLNLRWIRQRATLEKDLLNQNLNQEFLGLLLECPPGCDASWRVLLWAIASRLGIKDEQAVALFKYNIWHQNIGIDLHKRLRLTDQVGEIFAKPSHLVLPFMQVPHET